MEEIRPVLRADIEVIPTSYQGQKGVIIRDSIGLIPNPVFVQGLGLVVISLLDGKRTVRDIQMEIIRSQQGALITIESIQNILEEMDKLFLLDNEYFLYHKKELISSYLSRDVRQAALVDSAYPKSPGEIEVFMEAILEKGKKKVKTGTQNPVKALIAPHIDLTVGQSVYSAAYNSIKNLKPTRILLLGVGHHLQDGLFSLTRKDYVSPLGRIQTDKLWVKRLQKSGEKFISQNDITHKMEHSIEFQFLFLQHLFGSEFSMLPILIGSFNEFFHSAKRPGEIPGMENFIRVLREYVEEEPQSLVVAGVDLSHIGPKFGHTENASVLLQETEKHDQKIIEAICKGDVEDFWKICTIINNKYNVCGFSALAMLMEIFPDKKGVQLDYDIWKEEDTQSAVSFTAIAFY